MRIAIVGASGGIGSEFVRSYARESRNQVYAFSRTPLHSDKENLHSIQLNFSDEKAIAEAAKQSAIDAPLDLVIVCTGVLHTVSYRPEKSFSQLNQEQMLDAFAINTIGPAMIAKHFIPKLNSKSRSVFCALSARVGSISDNSLGGWYSYRASKAALNMMIKCFAIETARKNKSALIIGLHPGTVDTELSAPFQKSVPKQRLFSKAQSVSQLRMVLDGLQYVHNGEVLAWDGQLIPA